MTDSANILVVDDDPEIIDTVEFCLSEAGYSVVSATDGLQALDVFNGNAFDLAIIDIRIPGLDGLNLTRTLKKQSDTGIIILSGLGDSTDKIVGLEIGADDYMVKPFETRELLARVRSVLRRLKRQPDALSNEDSIFEFDGWKLNATSRNLISPGNEEVELTSGEFDLLLTFLKHPNRVLSREQLLDYTHQTYTPAYDRSVDVQVGRLRKKIEEDPKKPKMIKTIRNGGYMFTAKVVRH